MNPLGITIIWATISLQEHPEILQKLEAFREAKRDGQMNGQSMLIAYMKHNKQSLNPFCIHHTKRLEGDDLVHVSSPGS
ncbi:hypothetical protein YC2023_043947 [Brassica napus]